MPQVIEIEAIFSEKSIRQAAGLAFAKSENFPNITYDKGSEVWKLNFDELIHSEEASHFREILNDYRLREFVDISTEGIREKIVHHALLNVYESLTNKR